VSSSSDRHSVTPAAFAAAISGPVSAGDVESLRRGLLAEGTGPVTRAEAEALFAIAAANVEDAGFDELFLKAVGNHLLSAGTSSAPAVIEAMQRDKWLDANRPGAGGLATMFARCLTAVLSGDGFAGEVGWLAERAADQIIAPVMGALDTLESGWVMQRLARPGLSRPETALAAFIAGRAPAPARVKAA
jgi:hypothetical protein